MLKIFKEKKLAYVAAGVSLLLQLISFLTTYQGAEYYFKGIFILAPILFAVAVQLVVYFLENSIRGRRNIIKIMALTLAISCSSYFSYIGIYNNVNSPLTYYQETYTNYQNTLQAKYDSLCAKTEKKAQQVLNTMCTDLTTVSVEWSAKKQELKELQASIENVKNTNTVSMTAPSQSSYSSYEEYAKAYQAYISASSSSGATQLNKGTKGVLKQYGYSNKQQVVKEDARVQGNLQNMKQSVEQLCKMVGVKQTGNLTKDIERLRAQISQSITEGTTNTNVSQAIYKMAALHNQFAKTKLNTDILTQCITLNQSQKRALMADYASVSSKDPSECKSNLQWEISKAITEINRIYTIIESDETIDINNYQLEDIYILPLLRLAEKDTRNMALLCLVIALLTDGLSLVFALMFCPEKEILEMKTVDELLDRDEPLFEKNIASALQLSLRQENGKNVAIDSVLDDTAKNRLAEFLDQFETSSVALNSGYSLQASLANLSKYQALIAILCQLDLACMMSDEEYQELFGEVEGGVVVLLKTRFLIWCNNQWKQEEGKEVMA